MVTKGGATDTGTKTKCEGHYRQVQEGRGHSRDRVQGEYLERIHGKQQKGGGHGSLLRRKQSLHLLLMFVVTMAYSGRWRPQHLRNYKRGRGTEVQKASPRMLFGSRTSLQLYTSFLERRAGGLPVTQRVNLLAVNCTARKTCSMFARTRVVTARCV